MFKASCLRPLMLSVVSLALVACDTLTPVPDEAVVIRNVSVVDVETGTVAANRTVVIEGDRVSAVGPADSFAEGGATQVDGSGQYLIPGLWDMHTHIFNNNDPSQGPNEWYFPLMVAHGVTGVRDMWVRPEDVPQVDAWNAAIAQGEMIGPVIAEVGTILDGPGSPLMADIASTPEEARAFVRRYAEAGVDFVKSYTSLSPETYAAIHEEAASLGLTVAGHVPKQMRASMLADMGARSIEHMDGMWVEWSTDEVNLRTAPDYSVYFDAPQALATFDSVKAAVVIDAMARNGTAQVPTLALWATSTVRPLDDFTSLAVHELTPEWERAEWGDMQGWMQFRDSDPQFSEEWEGLWNLLLTNVKAMHDAGVPFMTGTDIGNPYVYPGHSIHDELVYFVEAGLTPAEALRTGTLAPAQYLSATDSLGFVGPGAIASLVLLGGNPLNDIDQVRNITAVIQRGRVFDRLELDALMR